MSNMETLLAESGWRKDVSGMAHGHAATVGSSHRSRPHIFFHPDCDRRPWHRTRSADPGHAFKLQGSRRFLRSNGRWRCRDATTQLRQLSSGNALPALDFLGVGQSQIIRSQSHPIRTSTPRNSG
jgi:hypothetical protein